MQLQVCVVRVCCVIVLLLGLIKLKTVHGSPIHEGNVAVKNLQVRRVASDVNSFCCVSAMRQLRRTVAITWLFCIGVGLQSLFEFFVDLISLMYVVVPVLEVAELPTPVTTRNVHLPTSML